MKLIFLLTDKITKTPLDVSVTSKSSNIPNTTVKPFNIDRDKPIPSSSCSPLLISYSKTEKVLKIEAQLSEFKGYVNCELSTWCVNGKLINASPKTFFTCSENCKKGNVEVIQKKYCLPPE